MIWAHKQALISLPIRTQAVDQEIWLEACRKENHGDNATELFVAVNQAGQKL